MTKFEVAKDVERPVWHVERLHDDGFHELVAEAPFPTREAAVLWLIHQQHDEYFEIGVGAE